jgi:hypothetical protein
MGEETRLAAILRFLRHVAYVDLGIVVLVALICWLGDWLTAKQFGNGLIYGGVAAIGFGVSSVFGGWGVSRDSSVLYAQSASAQSMIERTRRSGRDVLRSYGCSIVWTVAGAVAALAGSLLGALSS